MRNGNDKKVVRRNRHRSIGATAPASEDTGVNVLPVGARIGEFEIIDLIGEGGFGIVYLAYDHSLHRRIALKEYMPSGFASRTRAMHVTVRSEHHAATFKAGLKSFVNEARLLAQFDSPSLVKVHRFWEANGTAYMVMPFYEGITLKQALKERKITPTESWLKDFLADMLDAIETIHSVQCYHRDIAPDNILLLKDGRPLLLDFGAARRVIEDLTHSPTVILKPGFAPIEQYAKISGLRQGAWTDMYALAAVVYYLITGQRPPPAVTRMIDDDMEPARETGKGRYSQSFLDVIDRALAVRPEQRIQSVAELRRALDLDGGAARTASQPAATRQNQELSDKTRINTSAAPWPTAAAPPRTAATPPRPAAAPPRAAAAPSNTARPSAAGTQNNVRSPATPANSVRPSPAPAPTPAPASPPSPPPANRQGPPPEARRVKPAWLTFALLLFGGIASGIFIGGLQIFKQTPLDRSADSAPPQIASNEQATPPNEAPAPPQASAVPKQQAQPQVQPQSPPQTRPQTQAQPPPQQQPQAQLPETPRSPPQPTAPAAPAAPAAEQTPARTTQPPPAAAAPAVPAPSSRLESSGSSGPQAEPPAPRLSREEQLWQAARTGDNPGNYESYLKRYPKGHHAPEAKLWLKRKAAEASAAATAAKSPRMTDDERDWTSTVAINQSAAYEAYLARHPNGRYAAVARDRIAARQPALPAARPEAPAAADARQANPQPQEAPAAAATAAAAPTVPPAVTASIAPRQSAPERRAEPPPVKSQESEAAAERVAPQGLASEKRTIKMADQTVSGVFSLEPSTGAVSGKVHIAWDNGNQYDGTLVRGQKEGSGQFVWADGQRYRGEWARDVPNGKGTIWFTNGNRYEGTVKDGLPSGHGLTRFKNGDKYEGAWVNGKSHGHGRYTWVNGGYWEGEFRDDKRTDNGKMVFAEDLNGNTAAAQKPGADSSGGGENPPQDKRP
jgi:serine/threonine protein kinase